MEEATQAREAMEAAAQGGAIAMGGGDASNSGGGGISGGGSHGGNGFGSAIGGSLDNRQSAPLQQGGYGGPLGSGFLGGGYSDSPGGSCRMPGYGGYGDPPPDRAGPSAGRAKYDHACHVIIMSPKLVA
jgi:hypothetical protein